MKRSPVTSSIPRDANSALSAAYPVRDSNQLTCTELESADIAAFASALKFSSGTNKSFRIARRTSVRNDASS